MEEATLIKGNKDMLAKKDTAEAKLVSDMAEKYNKDNKAS